MIVDAIVSALTPGPADYLLDIGCGNGALAARMFDTCDRWLGVDSSEYLISVARRHFSAPTRTFICQDAVAYARSESEPARFNKALCYGVFAYFCDNDAVDLLTLLHERFVNLKVIFIGSLPDPERAPQFYDEMALANADLRNPRTQIGVWRSRQQIEEMAIRSGWQVRFQALPMDFYQAHYRFNAILDRTFE